MTEHIVLKGIERTISGKKNGGLRRQGSVPAVLYGEGVKNRNIQVDRISFEKCLSVAGESTLVDLQIAEEEPVKVLIHDVQLDPMRNLPMHVDFYQVRMDKKITTHVPLHFVGVASSVKDLGGTLVRNLSEVEIECLPKDLISGFDVDIAPLTTFDAVIRISDLKFPEGIEVKQDPQAIVALVEEPRSEEELKALDEQVVENVESVSDAVKKPEKEEAGGESGAETPAKTEK